MTRHREAHPASAHPSVWPRTQTGARDGSYVAIGLTIIATVVIGIASAADPHALDELPAPIGVLANSDAALA